MTFAEKVEDGQNLTIWLYFSESSQDRHEIPFDLDSDIDNFKLWATRSPLYPWVPVISRVIYMPNLLGKCIKSIEIRKKFVWGSSYTCIVYTHVCCVWQSDYYTFALAFGVLFVILFILCFYHVLLLFINFKLNECWFFTLMCFSISLSSAFSPAFQPFCLIWCFCLFVYCCFIFHFKHLYFSDLVCFVPVNVYIRWLWIRVNIFWRTLYSLQCTYINWHKHIYAFY